MKQDKAKQAAQDEKLVPFNVRVKIGTSNLRIDPSAKQREETYQVALDILKNTPFFNAFLISADVPEIYMQEILGISLKVENQEFTVPLSSESLFINKGDIYQVYGQPIPDVLLTKEIKDSNAYKLFVGYSTGLIPPKKGRGRGSQKNKKVLRDESPKFKGEPENRKVSQKIRTSTTVVIQEPPSVPIKKTHESSGKLKGIEMLSEAAQLELATQKAIKESRRASRLKHKTRSSSEGTGKSAISSERVGTSPNVLDETVYDYEAQSDDDVWGLTDEETNKDKNEDDVSEEVEDKEENVSEETEDEEEIVNEEENVDEEYEEESDDSDRSFYITNTNDERTESNFDDHEISKEGKTVAKTEEKETANYEHGEDDTKGEDQKSEKEPKGEDQAKEAEVGVPDLVKIKEKLEFIQSTFSHLISSNLNEPFHQVKVSVIPETTQQPLSTPIAPPRPTTEDPAAPVINFEAVDSFLHKFHALEKDVQEVKQSHTEELKSEVSVKKEEYKDFIQETVANEVKNQLSQILPKAVFDFTTPKILMKKMKKSQSYQTADVYKILYNGLVNSYLKDKDLFESYDQTISLKRNHEEDKDEEPSARPNQDQSVKEPEHEVQMNFKEPTFENVASDAGQPTNTGADKTQPKADPKIPKKDWFKDSPKPEVLDPEWNTVKDNDDTPKQPWFKRLIQAVKPPLTFDELMSDPIEFLTFAMNCLQINNITSEVLMGLVFNLRKGTCKSCVELEYNMEECYRALTNQLDWTNPKGHLPLVDMSKPLPLQDKEDLLNLKDTYIRWSW
ncbi:hypothetical protein Tco_1112988 [Tanacetum coccineum]|uniref:Uncharacterized protein n=1 Tax=Tanacetum coccineum TaxID=301880 RepID=A0ABQ5ISD1_9ASTR